MRKCCFLITEMHIVQISTKIIKTILNEINVILLSKYLVSGYQLPGTSYLLPVASYQDLNFDHPVRYRVL